MQFDITNTGKWYVMFPTLTTGQTRMQKHVLSASGQYWAMFAHPAYQWCYMFISVHCFISITYCTVLPCHVGRVLYPPRAEWRQGSVLLTHCGRVTQICVFLTRWNSVHLQVLLSATPQGGMFPEVSHPQALLGSLVSISRKFQFIKIVSKFVMNF